MLSPTNPRYFIDKRVLNDCLPAEVLQVLIRFSRLIADRINFHDIRQA